MKILWFSNCRLSNNQIKTSGTWLATMSKGLLGNGIQLYNITQAEVPQIVEEELESGLHQWVLPLYKITNTGLPSDKDIQSIQQIVCTIAPNIIQVWGMETYWGLLSARGYIKGNIILEIQGILGSCADVYYGGLSELSLLKYAKISNLRAIRRFSCSIKKKYEKWFVYEKEMLSGHSIISTQSDWVRAWIAPYVKQSCRIVNTGIIVRKEFLQELTWEYNGTHKLFVIMASLIPYKGLHDVIKAFCIIKHKYPDSKLIVAGNVDINSNICSTPEYAALIKDLINKNELSDSVEFLGSIDAKEIAEQMMSCDVMVHSSYVESYSLALAESMCLGIPSVVAYAGAMPELARDNESALFYRPGDYRRCASQILSVLESKEISTLISLNAISRSRNRNSESSVLATQLGIINSI